MRGALELDPVLFVHVNMNLATHRLKCAPVPLPVPRKARQLVPDRCVGGSGGLKLSSPPVSHEIRQWTSSRTSCFSTKSPDVEKR